MRRTIMLFLVVVAACSAESAIAPTAGIEALAVPLDPPPPEYQTWWDQIEQCSGLTGDFSRVRFYAMPQTSHFEVGGVLYGGYWIRSSNKVIIADAWMWAEKYVKHEEMHALLQSGDHPPKYFNGVCGNLL